MAEPRKIKVRTFNLDERLDSALMAEARRLDRSPSWLIRHYLRQVLNVPRDEDSGLYATVGAGENTVSDATVGDKE